jgi:general secretion pathway protein F
MPAFIYKAVTSDGELVKGILNGTSRSQVINQIQSQGQTPIRVDASTDTAGRARRMQRITRQRITTQHIAAFTRELGTLLRAGIPLERALAILASLADGARMRSLIEGVRQQVKTGDTLADAMQAQEEVFSRFYLNLVRAGEAGGALEVVLERLAEQLEQSQEMRNNLLSALIYPAILVLVALSSIFILLGYVVPRFTELFEGVGEVLPLSTRITIATGEFLQHYGWIMVLLAVATGWLVHYQLGQPRSRYRWHRRFLRLPLVGPIITRIEVARFARTLGTLLDNGVPLLQALGIVKDTAGNEVIASGLERVAGSLREGQSLATPLAEVAHFPAFASHMIRVGEESGQLVEILQQVAHTYERETQASIKRALVLLEPALILVLGVVIAAVIISILVAILGINQLVF